MTPNLLLSLKVGAAALVAGLALGGLAAGKYQTPIGGKVELRADGFLAIDDGTGNYLAGAALPLLAAVPSAARVDESSEYHEKSDRPDESMGVASAQSGRVGTAWSESDVLHHTSR